MQSHITPQSEHHYFFVTGRLAETAVREIVESLSQKHGFDFSIGVMPITVAALMTPHWLRRHLDVPTCATHVIVPGYCDAGVETLAESTEIPVIVGPKDCRDMATVFGDARLQDDFGQYSIEIIAEINHAPRRDIKEVVAEALSLREQGADVIDFGCDPSTRCERVGEYISALTSEGLRVSIDSFDEIEIAKATKAGASLVLSVNSANRRAAPDWGCEVVVIPDQPGDDSSFHATIDELASRNVPMRLDPILEPIGAGFTPSLLRYAEVRRQYPDHAMMMGIGNLTELTDVDSAGVNMLLLGICEELGIESVLTTQVINWARSSVRECDLARRLTHYSVQHRIPPKRLSDQLLMLRDDRLIPHSVEVVETLAASIRDNNYRILAQDDLIHIISAGLYLKGTDPFEVFSELMDQEVSGNVDPSHAFYLGFEMAKASIALLLGKQYEQDQALRWGHLTREEKHHRLNRRKSLDS